MPDKIEIMLRPRGFDVTTAGQTTRFATIRDVLDYAQRRLELATELADISRRCE